MTGAVLRTDSAIAAANLVTANGTDVNALAAAHDALSSAHATLNAAVEQLGQSVEASGLASVDVGALNGAFDAFKASKAFTFGDREGFSIQTARVNWGTVKSAGAIRVATFKIGFHQGAAFMCFIAHTDWCNHSGGGRIVSGIALSGYESPGSIEQDSFSPDEFNHLAFRMVRSDGSNNYHRSLEVYPHSSYSTCPNTNAGPGNVYVMMIAVSPGGWVLHE